MDLDELKSWVGNTSADKFDTILMMELCRIAIDPASEGYFKEYTKEVQSRANNEVSWLKTSITKSVDYIRNDPDPDVERVDDYFSEVSEHFIALLRYLKGIMELAGTTPTSEQIAFARSREDGEGLPAQQFFLVAFIMACTIKKVEL